MSHPTHSLILEVKSGIEKWVLIYRSVQSTVIKTFHSNSNAPSPSTGSLKKKKEKKNVKELCSSFSLTRIDVAFKYSLFVVVCL